MRERARRSSASVAPRGAVWRGFERSSLHAWLGVSIALVAIGTGCSSTEVLHGTAASDSAGDSPALETTPPPDPSDTAPAESTEPSPVEPARGSQLPDAIAGSTLTLDLEVMDASGDPFTGNVHVFLTREVRALFDDDFEAAWSTFYGNEVQIEGGAGQLQLTLSPLDSAIIAEWEYCEATLWNANARGPTPLSNVLYADPSQGVAAFEERVHVADWRGAGKGLVAELVVSLAPPPYYGTIDFSRPLEEGDRLLTEGVFASGGVAHKTGLWRGIASDLVDLPEGATTVDVYSWSRSNALAATVYDREDDKVAPEAILRFDGTVTIER